MTCPIKTHDFPFHDNDGDWRWVTRVTTGKSVVLLVLWRSIKIFWVFLHQKQMHFWLDHFKRVLIQDLYENPVLLVVSSVSEGFLNEHQIKV